MPCYGLGVSLSSRIKQTEGIDSCEVTGLLAHGWPIRLTPNQRVAVGVQATSTDPRLRKYAVALTVGSWLEGSWQIVGTCTAIAPGQAVESRGWIFGCWLLLQAVLGRHQLNIPHRAGWAALQKQGARKTAPDLWHNLPADEWQRLTLLNVPAKMLKEEGRHSKGWLQFIEAKLVAKGRSRRAANPEREQELQEADRMHQAIYEVAAKRISKILQDADHYMHGTLEKVEHEVKVPALPPKKGRVELFNQLVLQTHVAGQHKWLHHRGGVICEGCGKKIKACSTHDEISTKQATLCPGAVTKTLKQVMSDLVGATEHLQEGQPGHKWEIRASSFGCTRCWCKLPLKCSKGAIEHMTAMECIYGQMSESARGSIPLTRCGGGASGLNAAAATSSLASKMAESRLGWHSRARRRGDSRSFRLDREAPAVSRWLECRLKPSKRRMSLSRWPFLACLPWPCSCRHKRTERKKKSTTLRLE